MTAHLIDNSIKSMIIIALKFLVVKLDLIVGLYA